LITEAIATVRTFTAACKKRSGGCTLLNLLRIETPATCEHSKSPGVQRLAANLTFSRVHWLDVVRKTKNTYRKIKLEH